MIISEVLFPEGRIKAFVQNVYFWLVQECSLVQRSYT